MLKILYASEKHTKKVYLIQDECKNHTHSLRPKSSLVNYKLQALPRKKRKIDRGRSPPDRGYYTGARRYEFYFRVVKYCFCHSKIKFISSSRRVMFFLLYRHADGGVFDDFPKISTTFRRFPKKFQNCSEGRTNAPKHFPRISEDTRRLAKTFEGDPKMFR